MKSLLAVALILSVVSVAHAQAPAAAPAATYKVEFNDPEINATIQLLDVACKQTGTSGGCREAIFLIDKLDAARKNKPAAEAPKAGASADATKK